MNIALDEIRDIHDSRKIVLIAWAGVLSYYSSEAPKNWILPSSLSSAVDEYLLK